MPDSYFARPRGSRKLIRRSLKADVLSVARLRLADFEIAEREATTRQEQASRGKMTSGEAMAAYRMQTEASPLLKPLAKKYRGEVVAAIVNSWPGIEAKDVRSIGENECKE